MTSRYLASDKKLT